MNSDEYRDWLLEFGIPLFPPKHAKAAINYVQHNTRDQGLKAALECGRFTDGKDTVWILPDQDMVRSLMRELKADYSSSGDAALSVAALAAEPNKWLKGPYTAKPGTLFHVMRGRQPKAGRITLTPRVPESVAASHEDRVTPRVCLCRDIGGCFAALYLDLGRRISIWTNVKAAKYYIPTTKSVYDAEATGEVWVLYDLEMVRCESSTAVVEALAKEYRSVVPTRLPAVKRLRERLTKTLAKEKAVRCR